ncbi:MAG: hypothetical protein WAM09_10775 [Anaerolineales bacterium]
MGVPGGVSGTGVAGSGTVWVGGMDVGLLVLWIAVPVVVQLASARMMRLDKMGNDNFLTIFSSFDQYLSIIDRMVLIHG